MTENYYIGSGKRRKKAGRKTRLAFFLAGLLALLLLFRAVITPHLLSLAEDAVRNRVAGAVAQAVGEVLSQENTGYTDLITLSFGEDGRVTSLAADTLRLEALRYRLAQAVLHALRDGTFDVSIPLGTLTGILFLSGRGPAIPVKVRAAESLRASFVSSFSSCGFNQTRHRILFRMEIRVGFFLSLTVRQIDLTDEFCAAETVIVGEVPQNLTQINRFTEDVEEIEIDDAVDFGNIMD